LILTGTGDGGPYQFFEFTELGQIRTPSAYCADATGLKVSDRVKMNTCDRNVKGQQWTLVAHAPHAGTFKNQESKLCIFADKENKVTLSDCNKQCGATWEASAVHPKAPIVSAAANAPIGTRPHIRSTKGGRILCWVLTQPKWHSTKAAAVNNTWGKDCDILFFASSQHDPNLEIVVLDLGSEESRSMLWPKSQQMWMYVYQNYLDKADWFIKADDDTCASLCVCVRLCACVCACVWVSDCVSA
jgi:glycoprotein-N-acetylgalactosamine 3-beta-galactosyltransferase